MFLLHLNKIKMRVLSNQSIIQKINRLSIQIVEHHYGSNSIYLIGINNNGYNFAKLLQEQLQKNCKIPIHLHQIRLNPANPLHSQIELSMDKEELSNKNIIIVDDVANTGRTLFYAMKPLLDIIPSSIEVAVMVDRTHKSFPVRVDFVGLSLATTLKEHIEVILTPGEMSVFLQ